MNQNRTVFYIDEETDAFYLQKAVEYHEWLIQQEAQPRLTRTPIFHDREDAERRLRADYFDDHCNMETQGETSNSNTHVESNEFPPRPVAATATQDQTEANDVSNEVEQVGRKRKLTSPCWNHFKKIKVNGEWKEDCNYCHKRLAGSSKHGTKNLNDHHKHCLFRPVSNIRQHILVEEKNKADGTPSSFLSNYTFNEDTSRQNLAEMIIVHEYPLSMIVHEMIIVHEHA
ncbi:zinc finger BED domain-containing protein RICESLEEPER 2-like protein [Tanacetum coccineum]